MIVTMKRSETMLLKIKFAKISTFELCSYILLSAYISPRITQNCCITTVYKLKYEVQEQPEIIKGVQKTISIVNHLIF